VIPVLVVDDHRLVRAGLITLLEAAEDIEVVGEAADGRQALEVAGATRPAVTLMDLSMPVLDGAEATAQARHQREHGQVHIGSIFRRISVRDRTSAALWARENLTGPGTT
jgi:DNA-binding NarL/FixJ family response regulator